MRLVIDRYVYDKELSFAELIIPTMDSVRYRYLLDLLVTNNKNVMMSGPTGTGKTVNVSQHLQTGFSDKFVPLCITFSAQTSANQTQAGRVLLFCFCPRLSARWRRGSSGQPV